MSEKKLERDLLNDLAEAERERRKLEKELSDFSSDPFKFISTNWQFNTEDHAEQVLNEMQKKKEAKETLLQNKKNLFEELGLEWDEAIVKWIETDRLMFVGYYDSVPNTKVPDSFRKKVELLANYINKHTKLGKLL